LNYKFRNLTQVLNTSLKNTIRQRLSLQEYLNGIRAGDKIILAQAITLVESQLASDAPSAESLLETILPLTGNAIRIGITGSPGVGKSTFIEAFGNYLTAQNKKVAVLAIDPSSTKTKGSILGDKTRMEELSKSPLAFIRPTATGSALGGVADRTREAILLCEAAGFEIIIIETVGVGQSETAVRGMVDFFLLLMLAGAGDELQGIKKGIMEMADGIVITKADGENQKRATQAQADFQHALHLFQLPESGWSPKVITSSAIEKKGIAETWKMVEAYQSFTQSNSYLKRNRQDQNLQWFNESYELGVKSILTKSLSAQKQKKEMKKKIIENKITPLQASKILIEKIIDQINLKS
jgi:LAO/AO transport system kinase